MGGRLGRAAIIKKIMFSLSLHFCSWTIYHRKPGEGKVTSRTGGPALGMQLITTEHTVCTVVKWTDTHADRHADRHRHALDI